jgi:membrane fusion protein (multidrug efflux system)
MHLPSFGTEASPSGKIKRIVIIAAVVIGLLLAGSFGFRMFMMMQMGGGGGPPGGFATAVVALPPRAEKPARVVGAVGTLKADQSILVAAEAAGRIMQITGHEGAAVKAGDVLVKLDQAVTQAELNDSLAALELAKANYGRANKLASSSFGTVRSKDEAYAAQRQAEAQVELNRARLEKTVITAPFDGVLGLRQQSVGAYVNPGDAILSLSSRDPMLMDFRVPELKSANIVAGQKVKVSIDALPGREVEGEVIAVDPQLDEAGRSLAVRARLPNPDGALRAGMFTRTSLIYGAPVDVLVVPERAIFLKPDGAYVFRAVGDKAVETRVQLGERRVGEVEIIGGIAATDEIVTDGQIKLQPDAKIMLINKPNTPKPGEPMLEVEKKAMEEKKETGEKKTETPPPPAPPAEAAPQPAAPASAPAQPPPEAAFVPAEGEHAPVDIKGAPAKPGDTPHAAPVDAPAAPPAGNVDTLPAVPPPTPPEAPQPEQPAAPQP